MSTEHALAPTPADRTRTRSAASRTRARVLMRPPRSGGARDGPGGDRRSGQVEDERGRERTDADRQPDGAPDESAPRRVHVRAAAVRRAVLVVEVALLRQADDPHRPRDAETEDPDGAEADHGPRHRAGRTERHARRGLRRDEAHLDAAASLAL